MPKNLVVCCDGTGNDFSGRRTNVVKLFCRLDGSDPTAQVAFYDPGVGTPDEPGSRNAVAKGYRKVTGLAFGRGVFKNVLDGYGFLAQHYTEGDRIFLFGFSRGAYTVRAIAGMLYKVGLVQPGSNLMPYALRLFKTYPRRKAKQDEHWEEVRRFKATFARPCPTHFVGVWDTVNSIGAWGTVKSLRLFRALGFKGGSRVNYTATNPELLYGRHAVSIDERRIHFRTNLWNQRHSEHHQEVWFPGVHSDVGGGYAETGLSDITLKWMLEEASRFQLRLRDDAYAGLQPDPLDKLHNSLLPVWWTLGWRKRRIKTYGDWPVHVHASVRRREEATGGEYSPDLPDGAINLGEVAPRPSQVVANSSSRRPWYRDHRMFCGVFEGGGAKGVAHVGALHAMAERKCWFRAVAGASAGAITAALVAAGLSPDEIEDCSDDALRRIQTGTWAGLRRLRTATGYFPAEGLRDWLDALLQRQVTLSTGSDEADAPANQDEGEQEPESVTFAQLFETTRIELNVVAADLSLRSQIVFSHHDTPHCAVADAVVASSSIPYAFPSKVLQVPEEDFEKGLSHHTIVDGGVWANFPMYVFEDPAFRRRYKREPEKVDIPILGFLLHEEGDDSARLARGEEIKFVPPGEEIAPREWSASARAGEASPERWTARLAAWLLYPFYLLGRLANWKSGVARGRWPDPRSKVARYMAYIVDGLLGGMHPLLFGVIALAVVAVGAWHVGKWLVLYQVGSVQTAEWTDAVAIIVRLGGFALTAVAVAVAILLLPFALLGIVANRFLLPASRRILYGLVTTYVAGSGAPHWAVMKNNVIALPIPRGVKSLTFDLGPDERRELIAGAREATLTKLDNEVLPK